MMKEFSSIVQDELTSRCFESRLLPVQPFGSTESWLSGTDDGSRTGQGKDQHAIGHPSTPKPLKDPGAGRFGILGNLQKTERSLNIITKKVDKGISTIQSPDEWVEIEVTVDSGACETVMPADICKAIAIMKSMESDGAEYEVANGECIPNLGERRCLLMTVGSKEPKKIVFQVADVHKPLLSISRCADMGFDCHLGKTGGYLEDTVTGERIPLARKDNLYTMRAWIRRDPDAGNSDLSFTRPR